MPLLVTAAIIQDRGRFLLTRRMAHVSYPLLWEFPGGKVEPGEDPCDCIIREVREELAMEIAVERIYDVIFHRYPERDVLLLAYRCRWLQGAVIEQQVSGHCWAEPAQLPQFELLPADIPLVERICREYASSYPDRL